VFATLVAARTAAQIHADSYPDQKFRVVQLDVVD
jgi:hypothetical protein